ncbi:MAG: glycoside hydrolase family 31 protein [Bacteroidota bacterium]
MGEEKIIPQGQKDASQQDFSGNYIENFKSVEGKDLFPGAFTDWEKIGNRYYFHGENATLEISVESQDIFKFRYGNFGYFEDDFSYAVDPDFEEPRPEVAFKERGNYFALHTTTLKCYIYKDSLKFTLFDAQGQVLLEDEKGYHWQYEKQYGGDVVISTKKIHGTERFYGLGDKTGKLDLMGTRRELWGTDCYGYGNETDPVYKNVPFFLGLNKGIAFGIFFDNTFRTFFDFGQERKGVTSFWAQGGEMRYYFIYGPTLLEVVQKYTSLTGKPKLPPKWALGYQQSKWSYYPEAVVKNLAKEFRDRKIPCDVIHLDIDYMDGFRCFTWDHNKFPDPRRMIGELKEEGFKTVVIIDPGIKIDKQYHVYQEGIEGNHFCTRGDGPLLKGSVWPGLCHFPDFTNPKTRKWWATLFEGLAEDGVDGVWNDMNEPATFEDGTFPFDARHDYDGHPCTHRKGHNVYGSLMASSTRAGLEKNNDSKRPFTISRSAYAGIQRDACVWTGDNVATWEHLKIANVQCQRLSASGISFAGSDVGGFIGTPSGELYTRWIQMAVFHPFFRTHSSGDHGDKEPWVFGEKYLTIIRRFIELRYELLPYIYTTFWEYASHGVPMIKSIGLAYQNDPDALSRENEFLFGNGLLVAPVCKEGCTTQKVYLPAGKWYDFWSFEPIDGKGLVEVSTPLDSMPIFVKEGSILHRQPAMQYTDEFAFEQLRLDFFFSQKDTSTTLYEDEGDGYDYHSGEFCKRTITTEKSATALIIHQSTEGSYDSCYKYFEAHFHGFEKPGLIMIDGVDSTGAMDDQNGFFSIVIPKNFTEILFT